MPVNVTGRPATNAQPSSGLRITTSGGAFTVDSGRTATPTAAAPLSPPPSVTDAVIVCMPSVRIVVSCPPVPRNPWRLDVHVSCALRSPSAASLAVAASVTGVPAGSEAPRGGAVIVTVGGWFGACTDTVTCAWPRSPLESVAAAVSTCVPGRSAAVTTAGPDPSGPSRLEVHSSDALRFPSSRSVAVPFSVIGSPAANVARSTGDVIATAGALPASVMMSLGGAPPSFDR